MTTDEVGAGARPTILRPVLVGDLLASQDEPIPMLTTIDTLTPMYAWLPRAGELRALAGVREGEARAQTVLTPGGLAALYSWVTFEAPVAESEPHGNGMRNRGIFRLTFGTGAVDRVNFKPRPGWQNDLEFAGSPDSTTVAIAETWRTPPPTDQTFGEWRLTVLLAGFSDTPARELFTMPGSAAAGTGNPNLAVQWSPDGTSIALAAAQFEPDLVPVVAVFDAASGRERYRGKDLFIQGSASWSPDSTRLLVSDIHSVEYFLDVATGSLEPIPFLQGKSANTRPRLLGFADDHHLMVTTQRGKTMTISTADPATGAMRPRVRWTAGEDMYPQLAQMPLGYWDH